MWKIFYRITLPPIYMSRYEKLMNVWWEFSELNPGVYTPAHGMIYSRLIYLKSLTKSDVVEFTPDEIMKSVGVSNWRTFAGPLNDLEKWGLITVCRPKNQHRKWKVGIAEYTVATTVGSVKNATANNDAIVKNATADEVATVKNTFANPSASVKNATATENIAASVKNATATDFPSRDAHGGSSNINNIISGSNLKLEEEKIKEKNNPLPPDKKENQKEEEIISVEAEEVIPENEATKPMEKKTKTRKTVEQPTVPMPENWTQETIASVNTWLAYKQERRQAYKPVGLTTLINKLARFDEEIVRDCIETAIASNWAGLFPEKQKPRPQTLQQKSIEALKQNLTENGYEPSKPIPASLRKW